MKKYVRHIAMGLVLILLAGLLAGCGETAGQGTAEPHIERPGWAIEWELDLFGVVEFVGPVEYMKESIEINGRTFRAAECIVHSGSRNMTAEKNLVAYFPEAYLDTFTPGQMMFVECDSNNYWRWVRCDSPLGGEEICILPFVDGKLVLEENALETGLFYLDEMNNMVKDHWEDTEHPYDLLPDKIIEPGMTPEEMIQFFTAFSRFYFELF